VVACTYFEEEEWFYGFFRCCPFLVLSLAQQKQMKEEVDRLIKLGGVDVYFLPRDKKEEDNKRPGERGMGVED
jgi:hypothetical protein